MTTEEAVPAITEEAVSDEVIPPPEGPAWKEGSTAMGSKGESEDHRPEEG
jgi:hypothetical protein